MRRIILTESQAKLLLEEIDRNDSIQKLIFCEPSDIQFCLSDEGEYDYGVLIPIIDGKEIGEEYLKIFVNELKINNDIYYQLRLDVSKDLRRLGIAHKICVAFILKDYPFCALFEKGTKNFKDTSVSELIAKVANYPGITIDDLLDENGNKIGVKAYCEK